MNPWARALTAIDAVFAEPVDYVGAGRAQDSPPIRVIWSDVEAPPFEGGGKTARTVSCEIDKTVLPVRPSRADRIARNGVTWSPNDVVDRDDIGRWVVTLERAA